MFYVLLLQKNVTNSSGDTTQEDLGDTETKVSSCEVTEECKPKVMTCLTLSGTNVNWK